MANSVTVLARDYTKGGRSLDRLMIFSDLIEYDQPVNFFSMRKSDVDQRLSQIGSDRLAEFHGTSVVAWGAGKQLGSGLRGRERKKAPEMQARTADAITDFWTKYFTKAGAKSVRITQNFNAAN